VAIGEDDRYNEGADPPDGHPARFAELGTSRVLNDVLRIIENCDRVGEADVVLLLIRLIFGRVPLERKLHTATLRKFYWQPVASSTATADGIESRRRSPTAAYAEPGVDAESLGFPYSARYRATASSFQAIPLPGASPGEA
jgi:hypothetical protein